MENCAYCTYLDLENCNSDGKYWCDRQLERHFANDPKCSSFCKAYSRADSAIKNAIDIAKSHQEEPLCYLTTMLCSILKLKDDNLYLKTIREFRKNVLQKDEKYKPLLVEYDIIGPKIAESLSNDPLRRKIAEVHFYKYITDIFYYIINNNTEEAVYEYKQMTNSLKSFYKLDNYSITTEQIDNADIEKSGHGKYIQKKITL